jgi:hypothetical protein
MSWGDLVQTITLVTVAITIALSARQSREAARQSALAHNALGQSAHQTMVGHGAAYLASMMTDEPELIAWFLATRGIPPASAVTNKRYMLMFLRMDAHEATYLAYLDGSLQPDVWAGWRRVIELDAQTPEFRTVWRVVSDSYSRRFVELLDRMLAACEPGSADDAPPPDNR